MKIPELIQFPSGLTVHTLFVGQRLERGMQLFAIGLQLEIGLLKFAFLLLQVAFKFGYPLDSALFFLLLLWKVLRLWQKKSERILKMQK